MTMKKIALIISVVALLVCLLVVAVSAIVPPINSDSSASSFSRIYGRPNSVQVTSIVRLINIQAELGSFNSFLPSLLYYNSSSNSLDLYLTSQSNNIRYNLSNGVLVASGEAFLVRSYFTNYGFFEHVPALRLDNLDPSFVIAYRSASSYTFVVNDLFVPGDGLDASNVQLFNSALSSWLDFYDKVYYYDENLDDAKQEAYETGYDLGFEQGWATGVADQYPEIYDEGYQDGVADGYETGYSEGLSTGLSQGLQQGQALGLAQGRQEGYETGFSEGYDTGYGDGLGAGYVLGYDDGLDVGYETGYADGFDDGYETGYDVGYDSGFDDGSGLDPELISYRLTFYLAVPKKANGSDFVFYDDYILTWRPDDVHPLHTLGFRDPDDEDEGPLAGFVPYHVFASFTQSQVNNPSSVTFTIPSEILDIVPTAEFGSIKFGSVDGENFADVFLIYDQYILGYNTGFQDADAIASAIGSMAAAPVDALSQSLDFEIFGLNVGHVVLGVLALVLIFLAWRLFKRFIPI